jgi:hypothetical protein
VWRQLVRRLVLMRAIKRLALAVVVAGGTVLAPVVTAPAAQACVWDAAWFFLHQCNNPPAPPPLPPEQRQYDPQTNPQGYPWKWWDNAGEHNCPPECL